MCFFCFVFHQYFGLYWAVCSVEADRKRKGKERAMGVTCNRCRKPESNPGHWGEVLFRQGSPLVSHLGNPAGQLVRTRTGREPPHFQWSQGHKSSVYRITNHIRSEKALWLCPKIWLENCFSSQATSIFHVHSFRTPASLTARSRVPCCAVT